MPRRVGSPMFRQFKAKQIQIHLNLAVVAPHLPQDFDQLFCHIHADIIMKSLPPDLKHADQVMRDEEGNGQHRGIRREAWKEAAPNRVINGTGIDNQATADKRAALEELRKLFTTGGFKVMGEIGLQYQGLSPSDLSVDKYFALAEELDVPVAIHMGTGGSGRANITSPNFRGSTGAPLLLEELLVPHPRSVFNRVYGS